MNWRDHITADPEVLVGKPVIKGTRLSVDFLLERLADGWSEKELLENYPTLTAEGLQAVYSMAAEILREERYVALQKIGA